MKYEARAYFRDLDGRTRLAARWGKTSNEAENRLRAVLKERRRAGGSGQLSSKDRITVAVELYFAELEGLVEQDLRSPESYQTYRYQYDKNLESRIGELRLFEVTTQRVSDVITAIRNQVGVATARTCKSILTGTFGLAVRHGAMDSNPVREIQIGRKGKRKPPRALDDAEVERWFELLAQDERAVRADLVDLSKFMLATAERIGECLAVTWDDLNWETAEIDCSHQIQRIKGQGLVRRRPKSLAGERVLVLPQWCLTMLQARWVPGTTLTSPIFPSSTGGFRDPHNVRKAIRDVRRPVGGQRRLELGRTLRAHRREAGLTQVDVVEKLGWRKTRISLIETGRVALEPSEAAALAGLYTLSSAGRAALMELVELAGLRSLADELAWVTSHVFRKTTATVLERSGQTPRQIADQLGHAFTSTTMNDYLGRKARNPDAALHLEEAFREIADQHRQTTDEPEL
ncbi:helix-turn-helix domain-containing protein [Kribbella sp. NPDC050820]|uniref:helix-turn-helix domain-containing protein n=1 Tax=Kribbella sp. NPDC050820 TaxID=3155408 RepID=UPI0033C418D5